MISSANSRRDAFKKCVDSSEARRRRQETTINLRKNKKAEQLNKRRAASSTEPKSTDSIDSTAQSTASKKASAADIPQTMATLESQPCTIETQIECVQSFRRMLSVELNPPVDQVIASGAMKYLVRFLTCTESPKLIFESAWALTNIASTNRTADVVESGAIPTLISLLVHNDPDIREQCAWALGNIAGDCSLYRDSLLHQQVMAPMIRNIREPQSLSLLGNVTWAISNLCRGKPVPPMELVADAVQPLAALLVQPEVTKDVHVDAVWALSYLCDGPDERIQKVLDSGAIHALVSFLDDPTLSSVLLTPTVRCLGNLVTGSDEQTQVVLDAGVLKHAKKLLDCPRKAIRKETCWLLSNIGAGTEDQISMLFSKGGLVTKIIDTALEAPWDVRKEALYAICNIATTGSTNQVHGLVQLEAFQPLCSALSAAHAEPKILEAVLDAFEKILEVGDLSGRAYENLLDEYNGVDLLERLQEHPCDEIYTKIVKILVTHFGAEDEMEDENLAPATTENDNYSFGVSKQLFPTSKVAVVEPTFNFGGAPVFGRATTNLEI